MKSLVCILLSLIALSSGAQSYKDLSQWNDICFCNINNAFHPQNVVAADNNWQIMSNMREGISQHQLDSLNIPYTQSQLLLLRSQKLIEKNGNIYKALTPILDSVQTQNLRNDSRIVAKLLYPDIRMESMVLIKYLDDRKMQGNSFSILFSYVLDGLIWNKMEEKKLIDERKSEGIWSGHYWFLENKRPFACGTNSFGMGEKYKFNFNWSKSLLNSDLSRNLFSSKFLRSFLEYIENNTPISDNTVLDKWNSWGALSADGQIMIPIIDKNEKNGISTLSANIVDKLLASFAEKVDLDTIRKKYRFSDNKETIVIFYHEVMWDLLNEMIDNGIVKIPSVLLSVNEQNMSEIKDILFLEKE